MLPFPKNAKQRIILASGVLAAIFVLAYYFGGFTALRDNSSNTPKEAEVAKQDARIKIGPTTDLIQRLIYLKCNDEEVFRTKPAENLIGLNINQVQKVYAGWTIEKFDVKEVAMSLKVDSYCREHANNMFIGIKDDHVAVFYGRPGPKAIVKEVTNITVSHLSSEDVTELKHGMVIQSREELLRTLEGLQAR
jgi:hypothetical protein